MRKYLLLFSLFVFISEFATAQSTQGEVVYEEKRNIHKTLPADMEAMKVNIPEFRTSKHQLLFTATETSYKRMEKTAEEKAKEQEFRSNRGGGRRGRGGRGGRFGRGGNSTRYTDIQENISLSSTDLMGKKFLVKGDLSAYPWKMTGESKQVGSFLCQKLSTKTQLKILLPGLLP